MLIQIREKFAMAECHRQHAASVRSPDFHSRKQRQGTAFFLPCCCSQCDVDAQRLEPTPEYFVMLLGQNLRRRHECGLISRFNCKKHRRNRDDGFSRADVAL